MAGRAVAGARGSGSIGRSQTDHTVSCRASQVFLALEVLKQVYLTRVDLDSGQGSVYDLGYCGRSSPRWELMALGSIYASQAGRKVVGREARDLAAAAISGGGSKLWRRQQTREAAASSGRDSKLGRRQQALEATASFGGDSKLGRRQQAREAASNSGSGSKLGRQQRVLEVREQQQALEVVSKALEEAQS